MLSRFNVEIYAQSKRDFFDPYTYHKHRFILFPNDNSVTQSIIKGYQYEPYIFKFLVDNDINLSGKTVVEAGSNNGNFTVDFSILVGNTGKVIAFEPQRIVYYQLCGNIFLNGLTNVWCHNIALGDTRNISRIEYPNYHSNVGVNFGDVCVTSDIEQSYETVQVKRLDEYDFNELSVIKADVQGYELFVLRGALATIEKHRPYVFIEIEDEKLAMHGFKKSDIEDMFKALNYSLYHFQDGMTYITTTGYCLDYVAIPNEKNPSKYIIP